MTLQDVIHKYISWRRVQGAKFETEAVMLYVFAKHVGGAIGCDTVTSAQVCNYLAGNGSLTRYRANKYSALKGFYVYAVSRGYPEQFALEGGTDPNADCPVAHVRVLRDTNPEIIVPDNAKTQNETDK